MNLPARDAGRLPAAFLTAGSASFSEFLASYDPSLLPGRGSHPTGDLMAPHGTTIVALTYRNGIVMAGDRRATMGNLIANRDMEKVFTTDEYSVVGIAGTAGLATELVRLFQVELEHYEKIEGALMSLEGKANRLASMIRANLAMAMQGLMVVPMFAGFDVEESRGRMFSYDVTGGCYEERDHHSVGSGSMFARGSLKKTWRPGLEADKAIECAVGALYDAADDDSATGGPDVGRRIWPTVAVVDAGGARFWGEQPVAEVVSRIVAQRHETEGGRA